MKYRTFAMILCMILMISLFTGCAAVASEAPKQAAVTMEPAAASAPIAVPNRKINEESAKIFTLDPNASDTVNIDDAPVPLAPAPEGELTRRDAEDIALAHAGFDRMEVSFLFSEKEMDDGVVYFEVSFRQGAASYEYEIHEKTGEILAFEAEHND